MFVLLFEVSPIYSIDVKVILGCFSCHRFGPLLSAPRTLNKVEYIKICEEILQMPEVGISTGQ